MKGVFHFSFIIITQPNGIFQDSSSLFPLKANKKSAPLDLSHPSKKAQRTDQPPKPRTQEPPRHRQTAVRYMEAAVFALLLGLSVASAAAPYDPPTVPELMDRFGLPRALLPETARRYLLHDDGTFEIFLDDGCVVEAGGYRVGYDIEVSGTVSPGTVTGLEGVRVRVLFAWVPITGVEVAGGEVTVHIGPIRKSFPAVGFKSSPQCIIGSAAADIGSAAADSQLPLVEQ